MHKLWFNIALFNFFIAACIGVLLRYSFITPSSWFKFPYWLHAHSHVASLGWVYLALFALLIYAFLPEKTQKKPIYKRLFIFIQVSVVGMLITFPIQGYAAWSIVFSSLHILLSYAFIWRFWKDLSAKKSIALSFIRAALF